jgi:WD40 repeat protein
LSDYYNLWLINAQTGITLATMTWEQGSRGAMAFSPDGRILATSTDVIELWDLSPILANPPSSSAPTSTPDAVLTQSAATVAAFTPTADLSYLADQWRPFEDPGLGIRFEYPAAYDVIFSGHCVPYPETSTTGSPSLRVGARITVSAEPTAGRSISQFSGQLAATVAEDEDSQLMSLTPISLGKGSRLSGYELQYRFGSVGRLGLAYMLRHVDRFLIIQFTAGLTCDAREIDLSELEALDRLLYSLEFVE